MLKTLLHKNFVKSTHLVITNYPFNYFHGFFTSAQCGNFIYFLRLRFYVKSISRSLQSSKTAISTHLEDLKLDLHEFLLFLKAEIHPKQKFIALKIAKMAFFELLNFLNWFHVKSERRGVSATCTDCTLTMYSFSQTFVKTTYFLLNHTIYGIFNK